MRCAQRLTRVFGIDIETCSACGGAVRIIACIEDPEMIEKILTRLDAKAAEPQAATAAAMPWAAPARTVRLTGIIQRRPPGAATCAARPRWRLAGWKAREKRAGKPIAGVESERRDIYSWRLASRSDR